MGLSPQAGYDSNRNMRALNQNDLNGTTNSEVLRVEDDDKHEYMLNTKDTH